MMNDIPLTSSAIDVAVEKPTITNQQPLIYENDPVISVSKNHEQKPSSSYLTLSVGDNRHFGLSNFQDPLFYQQPLHFHYNQSIPSSIGSGHETGDRARWINKIKFSEDRKRKPVASRKYQIEKSKSTHRRSTNSKKSKDKMITTKEKKNKASRGNVKKRKHTGKKINRSSIQQLRYQSKTRQELLLKRRRQQKMLLKRKKKLLKQRIASKKRSIAKVNKNKSLTRSQPARKLYPTNNRVASTTSSRRSLTSKLTRNRSITQSKTQNTGILPSSITRLIDNPKNEIVSNKIKHRTDTSTVHPVSQSTSKQMMNVTKHLPSTPSNILSSSSIHPTLSSKASSSTKLEQKLSKKNLLCSPLNVRKLSTSKSKQIKKRNRGGIKLKIRSPVHTTFKKNIRRYRKRRSAGRKKTKFPRCTSKTLITIAPMNTNDENMIKSIDIHNDNIRMRTSPSLFSLKNSLTDKQSSTSTIMPLTKNTAQLTSKNNNRRTSKIKCRRSSSISTTLGRKLQEPTRTGMTLRSRTIIINNINSTKRKGEKYE